MLRNRRPILGWMALCLLFVSNAGASQPVPEGAAIEMIGYISAAYEAGVVYFGVDRVFDEDTLCISIGEWERIWVPVPEDGLNAEDYPGRAVRIVLDEEAANGLAPDELVIPSRFELLGIMTGEVLRLADGFIDVKGGDAPVRRFIMEEETIIFNEIGPGNYVCVIYDENTSIAIEVASSNG